MSEEQIIADIRHQAEGEAEAIRAQHRDSLAKRAEALRGRERQIEDDAQARAETQEREIIARTSREAEQEERRIARVLEERAVRTVIARVRQRLEERRNAEDYPRINTEWAVEAAEGLGEDSGAVVVLRCAPADLPMIQAAVPELERRCDLRIRPEPAESLAGTIGVVALDERGRRAYSNTLEDRLRRSEQDIHRLVMVRLFDGSKRDE